jgi:quinolinate synthase
MPALPSQYADMTDDEVLEAIRRARATLGKDLTILGHHYQRDEVIQFADACGDSLDLSQQAAKATSRYIVFCGVYFMAESAAILCKPEQIVMLPAIQAFCPMAAMANARDGEEAWAALSGLWGDDLIPITYQNSNADLKAFVGRRGGAVCTSSNANKVLHWAWTQKGHVLFMPDQWLGTNTALAMGMPRTQIGLWDRGGANVESLRDCKLVAWPGFCYVHCRFRVEDVEAARARYPGARVIVHPECNSAVVARADATGTTTGIIDYVKTAPAGATIVVGTEWHLVHRLGRQYTDRRVVPLRRSSCRTMGMTTPRHLLYVLEGLLAGNPRNVIAVEAETAEWARVALERMLRLS